MPKIIIRNGKNGLTVQGITDKLRELGELQMSGADVYMSTFSQLKQFPFFRKISHWFYPFDPQYRDIAKLSLGNDEQKSLCSTF